MVNAQEYINKNYPETRKKQTKVLDIKNKNLWGSLKLEGFINLEEIYCHNNNLTNLDIRNCSKIAKLCCFNNPLENVYIDGIVEKDWKKVQEQLKDYLKENKKEIQYYDLKAWKGTKSSSSSVVSSVPSIRTNTSSKPLISTITQFIGNKTSKLTSIGSNEREMSNVEVADWEAEIGLLKSQLVELNEIVCPQTNLSFTNLKNEIQKLKIKELVSQRQTKNAQLERLLDILKNKVGEDLKIIISLFHQTQQQIIEHKQGNNAFANSQLVTYQNALQGKVNKEELLELSQLQKDIFQIEEQLTSLGYQQQLQTYIIQ